MQLDLSGRIRIHSRTPPGARRQPSPGDPASPAREDVFIYTCICPCLYISNLVSKRSLISYYLAPFRGPGFYSQVVYFSFNSPPLLDQFPSQKSHYSLPSILPPPPTKSRRSPIMGDSSKTKGPSVRSSSRNSRNSSSNVASPIGAREFAPRPDLDAQIQIGRAHV